jgi:hypothetical protein
MDGTAHHSLVYRGAHVVCLELPAPPAPVLAPVVCNASAAAARVVFLNVGVTVSAAAAAVRSALAPFA